MSEDTGEGYDMTCVVHLVKGRYFIDPGTIDCTWTFTLYEKR